MIVAAASNGYIAELLRFLGVSQSRADRVQDLLLRPLTVVIVIVATIIVSHLGARIIARSIDRVGRSITRGDHRQALRLITVGRIVANVWRVAIMIIGGITTLSIVGIDLAPFLAGATVIGATIGFGAQSLVRDFLSGFLMLLEDQYRIGDVVLVNDVVGTVEEVTLRVTQLRDADGTAWYIPNGQIVRLGNSSRHWSRARVEVRVRVDVPSAKVIEAVGEAATAATHLPELAPLCRSEPRVLGIVDTQPTALIVAVEVWTAPEGAAEVERAIRQAVQERLRTDNMLADTDGA